MNDIEELVHYCKESDPLGSLLLTGEWGSGKTHLIEKDLAEALGPDYVIVRVSLFGVNNIKALHDTITHKWIDACYPLMGRIIYRKEKRDEHSGFTKFINSLIKKSNPIVGDAADFLSSINIIDMVNIKPMFEDAKTHNLKKAILVFDDLERCNIDPVELLGTINEYCENQSFNTIIVANLRYLMLTYKGNPIVFKTLKEKTITQTILYQPDYKTIIHKIIAERDWRDEEYKQFLIDNEAMIIDVFESSSDVVSDNQTYQKSHNLLTLIASLQSFFRVYYHLKMAGFEDISSILSSFIPFMICNNNGIIKNDQMVFDVSDEEIKLLYPQYSKDRVFNSVRNWITTGGFDKEQFFAELKEYTDNH